VSLSRTLFRFTFLAAIAHQITYILVEGGIFAEPRQRVGEMHPKLREFVNCHLCVGTWTGLLLAALYRPRLLEDVQDTHPSLARRTIDMAGDAFLIGLGSRVWNELLGWLRRAVQVQQQEIEQLDAPKSEAGAHSAVSGISVRH
jgi:hypothetical protein